MWDSKAFPLDTKTVRSAFSRILECTTTLFKNSRLFLFIDGLDEYEETLEDDFKDMVQLLLGWTQTTPHAVKLCVSSREENVFMNFFADDKRLRLQDLTLPDMTLYVRDKLQELSPDSLNRIVLVITEKADGIFLWVALVVKSIRASLEDSCSLSLLEAEVNSLPDELEDLFKYLLASISKSHRRMAYQTFRMIDMCVNSERQSLQLSLFAYSFLDEYEDDPEFAEKDHHLFGGHSELVRRQREEAARKRLIGRCKGLAEANHLGVIAYTHRSVVEFLETNLQHLTAEQAEFSTPHALAQLLLAEIRGRPKDNYWVHKVGSALRIGDVLRGIIFSCDMSSSFLETLRAAANLTIPESGYADMPWSKARSSRADVYPADRYYPASVLHKAVEAGVPDFIDRGLSAWRSDDHEEDKLRGLVQSCWFSMSPLSFQPNPFAAAMVVVQRIPKIVHVPGRVSPSFWGDLLLKIFDEDGLRQSPQEVGVILLESLQQGAESNIHFVLEMGKSKIHPRDGGSKLHFNIVGGSGTDETILFCRFYRELAIIEHLWVGRGGKRTSDSFYSFFMSKQRASFEEYIGFYDFEHKAAVLELCAQRRRTASTPLANTSSITPPSPTARDITETEHNPTSTELFDTEPQISWPRPPTPQLAAPAEPDDATSAKPKDTASAEPQGGTPDKPVAQVARKEPAQTLIRRLFQSRVVDTLLGKSTMHVTVLSSLLSSPLLFFCSPHSQESGEIIRT